MKLNVLERIVGVNILGEYKEGNFITFKTVQNLKSKLMVNETEVKDFELRIENDRYAWSVKGNEEVELEITDGEKDILKNLLVKLNEKDKLPSDAVSLYEKFVEN